MLGLFYDKKLKEFELASYSIGSKLSICNAKHHKETITMHYNI